MKRKVFVLLSIIIVLIISFGFLGMFDRYNKVVVKPVTSRVLFDRSTPTPTPDPLAPYNVLLLGYGGPTHDGGFLTDTMIVAHIRPRDESIHLISIPRDIWVPLPLEKDEDVYRKVNAAYAFGRDQNKYKNRPEEYTGAAGGGQLAKYAAEYITGMPVRYFTALSFDGFTESIDTLGGVGIYVPHTFTDELYPIEEEKENDCGKSEEEIEEITATLSGELLEKKFPCRYETLEFVKGEEHMDGQRALKFVRSRKSNAYGGDYNRSLRQFALLKAIKEKVITINFIPKIFPFVNSLTRDMQTDIDAGAFKQILETHPDASVFEINTIRITGEDVLEESRNDNGQYILIPKDNDWDTLHSYIQSEISGN